MTLPSTERRRCIALVGRPNVGKSTLFNRLVGTRRAVVSSIHGTTRDRLYGETTWRGIPVGLIDTGGFDFSGSDALTAAVQRQIERALAEADALVLVCDAQEGQVPADAIILERLRKTGKPIILVVNKADHQPIISPDFFSFGIAPTLPISALHGRGIGELLDHLVHGLARPADSIAGSAVPALAIVGRQNVGKSSLFNALVREERVIVNDLPVTTRDAIDTRVRIGADTILLIDTAGLRHRRKVKSPVDFFAMSRSLEALQRCEVALVVLDATEGVTRDDRRIVSRVCEAGRGLVLLMNKWDMVKGGRERMLTEALQRALPDARFAPILAVSAKTGFHVTQSILRAVQIARAMRRGLTHDALLALLEAAWAARPVPRYRGRAVRLRDAAWRAGFPARVELTTSPAGLPFPYQRYLLNVLRAQPTLAGIPMHLAVNTPKPRSA